jgi:hypothetical protein
MLNYMRRELIRPRRRVTPACLEHEQAADRGRHFFSLTTPAEALIPRLQILCPRRGIARLAPLWRR